MPKDRAQPVRIGDILVECDLRGHAPGLALGIDRAVVLAPGAEVAAPSITGTAILPELGNGSWGEGETIETALTFDEAVTVQSVEQRYRRCIL